MPTYEYECQSCGKVFEVFQSIKDAPITTCECGEKKNVKRLISSGAGILFKGSGFYETDYRSSDYKAKAKAEKDSSSPSTSSKSETGKGDSKTETSSKTTSDTKSKVA